MLMTSRRLGVSAAVAGLLLTAAAPTPAQPRGAALRWSTYLRAAAAPTAAVLDELEHDMRVQVLACEARWCRVTDGELEGYVDRDALDGPHPPEPADAPAPPPPKP